jgi:hypothetical protein
VKVTVNPTPEAEPTQSTASEPTTTSNAPAEPKAATWPEWFGIADMAMAVLVLIAAFLIGSFSARNSDFWPHLAAGRLIAEGKYTFGSDPFSYMTESRMWVNHNWLWDRIAYQIYKSDPSGVWLVGAKAAMFAMALLVLMLIRRPGSPLWPWAVTAGLAALAGGPFVQLRPFALNPLFVAFTLFVLFRLEWKSGSWRNPLLLAVTFGLWSNIDGAFILGPLAVLLVLIGELIQNALQKVRSPHEPFGPPPPVSGLAKALLLGVAACMVNPHHINVWQLPPEFAAGLPAEGMMNDVELISAVLEPYAEPFYDVAGRGKNLNGAAYLILFLVSSLTMAFSFGRLRVGHLLLWLAFSYLSLHQWQFILPYSIVAAAIASAYFNSWSSGIVLQTTAHPPTRVFLLGSGIGRIICVTLAIVMVPASWPGWLHPQTGSAASARRVAWDIDPDDGLVAASKVINDWRESGQLSANVRGFTPNLDFANYLAWYAPGEKVYANTRYTFHAPEIPDLMTVRQALYFKLLPSKDGGYDIAAIQELMAKIKAEFLAVEGQFLRLQPEMTLTLQTTPGWSVWHVGGRGLIVGPETNTALTYNPAKELLRNSIAPLPEVPLMAPPAPRESWLDDFLRRPRPIPFGTDEAIALRDYTAFIGRKSQLDFNRQTFFSLALMGGTVGARNRPLTDAELMTPILAIRAARQAIVENPDSPNPYFVLSQLYATPVLPEIFVENQQLGRLGEKQMQYITALQRFIARAPKPAEASKAMAMQVFFASEQLTRAYVSTGQLDLVRDMCRTMKAYFPYGLGIDYQDQARAAAGNEQQVKAINAQLEAAKNQLDAMETNFDKRVADASDRLRTAQPKGSQKFFMTAQSGLVNAAVKQFLDIPEEALDKEFGRDTIGVALAVVDILSKSGKLEQASAQLDRLIRTMDELSKDPKADPNYVAGLKAQVLEREFRIRVLEGNYRTAADALERAHANRFQPISPALLAAARPTVVDASHAFGPIPAMILSQPISINVTSQLAAESEFAFSRGLIAVYDGRPADAKARFYQSLAPQGEKDLTLPWSNFAARFLEVIEKVNTP